MRLFLLILPLLAACGGGDGSPSPTVPPVPAVSQLHLSGVTYPPSLYYTPQPTEHVTAIVTNTGGANSPGGAATLRMDGLALASALIPTLTPGESATVNIPVWNYVTQPATYTGPATVDHAFTLSVDGDSVDFVITFVVNVSA